MDQSQAALLILSLTYICCAALRLKESTILLVLNISILLMQLYLWLAR